MQTGVTKTISAKNDVITFNGYFVNGAASIAGTEKAKIISENIKQGVTILGVEGSLSSLDISDTTATTHTVKSGETFYDASGTKQTGAMPEATILVDGTLNTGQTILPKTTQRTITLTEGYMNERTVDIYPVTQSGLEAANIVQGKVVQVKASSTNLYSVTGTGTYYDYFREQKSATSRRSMYGATSTSTSNRYYVSYTSPANFRVTTVMYAVVTGSIYKWGIINFDGSYNGGTQCAYCCDATHQQKFTSSTHKTSFAPSSGWNSAGYLNPGSTVYMPVDTQNAVVNYVVVGYYV